MNQSGRVLMRVFRDLEIVEQLGLGVSRILKAYTKDVFIISENYICVVLPFTKEYDVDKQVADQKKQTKKL